MLYHTVRISLHLPRIARPQRGTLSLQQPELLPEAFNICDSSIETIIGIIRRFEAQHTLQKAPLIFVHGVILAADALLKLAFHRSPGDQAHLLLGDSPLTTFNAALTGLSSAWEIANDVGHQLQSFITQLSHSVPVSALPSPPEFPSNFYTLPLTDTGVNTDLYESQTTA